MTEAAATPIVAGEQPVVCNADRGLPGSGGGFVGISVGQYGSRCRLPFR